MGQACSKSAQSRSNSAQVWSESTIVGRNQLKCGRSLTLIFESDPKLVDLGPKPNMIQIWPAPKRCSGMCVRHSASSTWQSLHPHTHQAATVSTGRLCITLHTDDILLLTQTLLAPCSRGSHLKSGDTILNVIHIFVSPGKPIKPRQNMYSQMYQRDTLRHALEFTLSELKASHWQQSRSGGRSEQIAELELLFGAAHKRHLTTLPSRTPLARSALHLGPRLPLERRPLRATRTRADGGGGGECRRRREDYDTCWICPGGASCGDHYKILITGPMASPKFDQPEVRQEAGAQGSELDEVSCFPAPMPESREADVRGPDLGRELENRPRD